MKTAAKLASAAGDKCVRIHGLARRVVLVAAIAILGACGITSEGLSPKNLAKAKLRIDKTVKVMPVVVGPKHEAFITGQQFHQALSRTIASANMFSHVVDSGAADLELFSEVVTVAHSGGISPSVAVVVQYWMVDPRSGRDVWRKGINTRHRVQWNEAFAGGTRGIMAIEGATQKNLVRLIEELEAAGIR